MSTTGKYIGALYLTRRFYIAFGAVIVLYIISFLNAPLKLLPDVLIWVFVLLAVIVIAGGIAFYFSSKSADITPKNTTANRTPSPAPSATTNGKDDLREQIANLEKRLNEQKSANRPDRKSVV